MLKFILSKDQRKEGDVLHIASGTSGVKGHLTVFRFIDKDTQQFVLYVPSFNASGYGATPGKALIMVKESLSSLFNQLVSLNPKTMEAALKKMGWKKNISPNKNFSIVIVDADGRLKNLNATDDKIERLSLIA